MAVVAAPKGGYQVGGWYWDPQAGDARQFTGNGFGDPGKVALGQQSSTPAPQSGPSQADIDAAFNPEFDALNKLQSGLESDQTQQLTAAQGKHDNQLTTVAGQETGLRNNLSKNQLDWTNSTQGAYSDALRAYNALQQRNNGLYGGQSSAGQAANDLLNQTYLQTRGTIGQQDASAQLAFKGQDQDITNWVADQHAKLDNWLLDAQTSIKQTFQQGINQINADRGATESAKAQAKLGLLQQLFTHQQALQDYDNQLRMQVELASKNLPQGQLDTTNFTNQIGNYGQAVSGATNNFTSQAQITPSFSYQPSAMILPAGYPTTKKNDDMSNFSNYSGDGSDFVLG